MTTELRLEDNTRRYIPPLSKAQAPEHRSQSNLSVYKETLQVNGRAE